MARQNARFTSNEGHELSGVLDSPSGQLRAFALFAHCFTCSKNLKAETDLKAVAELKPIPQFGAAAELPVTVNVMDADNQTIFRAVIKMWVSPKKQ